MRLFLRKSTLTSRDSLPMAMTGARMGERVLQVGIDDPALCGPLAARTGLSGQASIAVRTPIEAETARRAADESGVLLDVQMIGTGGLPFDAHAFDLVAINSAAGLLASLVGPARLALARECHRVLRPGGRVVAIEPGARTGITAIWHRSAAPNPTYEREGGAFALLAAAGFDPVRVLADREGLRFTEGLTRALP